MELAVVIGIRGIKLWQRHRQGRRDMDAMHQLSDMLEDQYGTEKRDGTLDSRRIKEDISKIQKDLKGQKDCNKLANGYNWLCLLHFVYSVNEALQNKDKAAQIRKSLHKYVGIFSEVDVNREVELIAVAFVKITSKKNSKLVSNMSKIENGARIKDLEKGLTDLAHDSRREISGIIREEVKAAFDKDVLKKEAKEAVKEEVDAVVKEVKGELQDELMAELCKLAGNGPGDLRGLIVQQHELQQMKGIQTVVDNVSSNFFGSTDAKKRKLREDMEKVFKPATELPDKEVKELKEKVRKEISEAVREEVKEKVAEVKSELKDAIVEDLKAMLEPGNASSSADPKNPKDCKEAKDIKEGVKEGAEGDPDALRIGLEEGGRGAEVAAGEAMEVADAVETVELASPVHEMLAEVMADPDLLACAVEGLAFLVV
mmetsp:Transcript_28226/g.65565  ORF Transcript_28226/g.65565 Transcript_28226/m.65565 type:complete len:428 (-) Transcript_28226:253-1536(-)